VFIALSCALTSLHAVSSSADKPVARIKAPPVRVDRYLYPVTILPTKDATAGECDHLSTKDLLVTARQGSVTKVESLDRIRLQTRHAILIDNSSSMDMDDRLDSAKRIAQRYVRRLRGESSFVFSGDEETILVQPSTDDPERAAAAIASIGNGTNTLLWNSIFIALTQLSLQPEPQKVLTVITDTGFFPSLHSQSDVLQLLREDPSLGLFVIGLAPSDPESAAYPVYPYPINARPGFGQSVPPSIAPMAPLPFGSNVTPHDAAVSIAQIEIKKAVSISEGELILVGARPTDAEIDGALERIRAWTRRRGTLSVALSADSENVRPQLKTKAISARCTVRMETVTEPQRRPLDTVRPVDSLLPLPPLQAWHEAYQRQAKKSSDETCRAGEWFVRIGEDRLIGCVLDGSAQEGILYEPHLKQKVDYSPSVELKTKTFLSFVPPLGYWPTGPFDMFVQIGRVSVTAPPDVVPPILHPLLVDGETFLAEQPWVAYALLQYPSYREWAVGRLREDLSRQLDALKQEFRSKLPAATPDWPEEELQKLAERATLSSPEGHRMDLRSRNPESRDLQGYVASWLGDLPAQSLFVEWEQRMIRAYLADPSSEFVEEARERWARVRRWLALPQWNRVVTPLVLTYDPTGNRLGYWRIVLPQASFLRLRTGVVWWDWEKDVKVPYDLIPREPLGLLAMERLAKKRKIPAGDYDVSVRYDAWFARGTEPESPYSPGSVEVTMKPAGSEPRVLKAQFLYDWRLPDPSIWDATGE
jgi:hypothetical protein